MAGDETTGAGGCDGVGGPVCRPLVACPECGRHVKKGAERCPFCGSGGAGRFARAVVVAAFFGAAAIPGCAYGPGPDDLEDATDDTAGEVSADGADGADDATGTAETLGDL